MDAHNPWGACGGAKSWDESVKLLSECGFTDLIACFAWGTTAGYASQVLAPLPELATKGDGLEQCLAACRKYGVKLHAWRCCWTTGSGSRLPKELQARLEKEGRLQVDASGKIVKDWLCPNHPENHRMHVEAMVELAKKGVDGINYDFIRYGALPERTCFCSNCRAAFEKELGRKVVNWPADVLASKELLAQWGEFRARSIGRGVKEIAARVRQECPQVEISTSGGGDGTTYRIPLGRDWLAWARAGWVDFVFLMDYADDVVSFDARIASQAKVQAGKAQLIPGLGPSCWPRRGVVGDAEAMADHIDAVRARGFNAWGVFEFDDRAFGYLPLLKQVNGIAR
ncbi:MAG: family 10 glycosylhydrolase [Kiritimatiellae bacterium]|nr:family 10 glycosylhydrolase [Kiritimatiellia bacterium]